MLIGGLTGGISSGKSTVLKIFKNFGCKTIDADEIAHQLTTPGTKVLREIVRKFGQEVLNKKGTLNRKRLAEAIFRDRQKRKSLNVIMHPKIIAEMKLPARETERPRINIYMKQQPKTKCKIVEYTYAESEGKK